MNLSPNHQPPESRATIRMDAHLDAVTRQKVEDLTRDFRKPRAAVVRHTMHWGLSRGQGGTLDSGESEGSIPHLYLYVNTELPEQIERAATVVDMNIAPWLRSMLRRMTFTDFLASWQEAKPEERSRDSRTDSKRFMLRLDSPSETKLQQLVNQFGTSKANSIRQLIIQTSPEDFPIAYIGRCRSALRFGRPPVRHLRNRPPVSPGERHDHPRPRDPHDTVVVTSLTEGHRLASDYFLEGLLNPQWTEGAKATPRRGGKAQNRGASAHWAGTRFRDQLRREFGLVKVQRDKTYFLHPEDWWAIYKTIFKHDPNSLVHGVMFAREQLRLSAVSSRAPRGGTRLAKRHSLCPARRAASFPEKRSR